MKEEDLSYKFFKTAVLVFLMFAAAINYNVFVNPTKIVAGGVNGISTVLEELINLNPATTMAIILGTAILAGLLLKEYELVLSALLASILYPLFVQLTQPALGAISISESDYFIVAVFSGAVSGFISGITCKLGISQGGITLIAQIIGKHFRCNVSSVATAINMCVIIIGGIVFGITKIFLAIILLFTSEIIMNKIIIGISQKKLFQIITIKDKEIIEYITNTLNTGLTIFKTKGGVKSKNRTVIMTSVFNSDYFRLKEGIHSIDKDAFVVITDSYQVKGGK